MDLVDATFGVTAQMPRSEFDLSRQIRRAAISIPCNIAEGYRRKNRRSAYQNHVSIAMGSQGELQTQLEIAQRNGLIPTDAFTRLSSHADRVGAMLYRLHESLK